MKELENLVKSVVYGGIGAAATIVEKGGDIARALVEKGQETVRANQDTVDQIKETAEDLKRRVQEFCERFMNDDVIDASCLTPEQRAAFTVIGGIKDTGWGTDFEMVEEPDGTWTSVEAFDLAAGTEFKVRQGRGWKVAYGDNTANADTSVPLTDKPNYKVETAGKYKIQLVVAADTTAVINLIPAE